MNQSQENAENNLKNESDLTMIDLIRPYLKYIPTNKIKAEFFNNNKGMILTKKKWGIFNTKVKIQITIHPYKKGYFTIGFIHNESNPEDYLFEEFGTVLLKYLEKYMFNKDLE